MKKQKITPCLWFDNQAEEAARFYTSLFKNSKIGPISHYGDSVHGKKGSVMMVTFQLDGQEFMALNGGPIFKFTEAISLSVDCADQQEVDTFWEKLSEGGEKSKCGWLKDKYGLSWQIVPSELKELMSSGDPDQSNRVMKALLQMTRLDIEGLRKAAREK